jgi:hypothetical protein
MADIEKIKDAVRDVFAHRSGKLLIYWLLEQSAIYEDAYTGDNNATNYTLGRQSPGRRLIALLDSVDPKIYPKLMLEIADIRAEESAAAALNPPKTYEPELEP